MDMQFCFVHTSLNLFCYPFQLVGAALDDMVHDDDFSSIDGHDTLIKRMAALHIVYMLNKSQIMWFGQLVSQNPSIMLSLKDKKSPDTSEMVFHFNLYACV